MEPVPGVKFCSVAHRDCIWKTAFESFPDYFRKKNLHGISSLPCAAIPVASNLDALGESLCSDVLGIDSEIFVLTWLAQGLLL